jgi:type I restriction enzyme, S subunit
MNQVAKDEESKNLNYKKTSIGLLPKDWDVLKAGEIFSNHTDKNHEGDLEVLSATQDRGIIPRSQLDIDIKYEKSSLKNYKKVEPGDFVISLRSFQGGIEYSEYEGIVSPAYTVLKNKVEIDDGFYKYLFKKEDFISRLNSVIYGIRDGKQISYTDFKNLKIQYPPIKEQNKIAVILSTWDMGIELKEKLIEQKKEQKKGLMQKLLTGEIRLPGFKGELKKLKLLDFCTTFSGGTPSRQKREYYENGTIPWIKSGELNAKKIIHTEEFITEDGLENSSAKMVYPETILLALYGATAGVVAMSKIKAAINQAILAIIPNENCNNKFLFYYLEYYMDQVVKKYTQGGQPNLNAKTIKNLVVNLPSIEEQYKIADILSLMDTNIQLLEKELNNLKMQKKGLMQLLLTGKVRVKV